MSAPRPRSPVDDAGDAVGLLQAQLLRAAHHRLALGEAAEQCDERQLVDRQRHLLGLDHGALQRAGGDVQVADGLVRGSSPVSSSRSPSTMPRMRCTMRRKPVRVQLTPTSREQQARAGHEHAGCNQERSRAGVAGNDTLLEHELIGIDDRDMAAVAVDATPARSSRRSVWSRLRAGSPTVVAPSAASAASSTHDLT